MSTVWGSLARLIVTVAHMEPQGTAHSIGEEAKPLGTAVGMAAARRSRGFPIWYECSNAPRIYLPCPPVAKPLQGCGASVRPMEQSLGKIQFWSLLIGFSGIR